jgi:hypothetical protein
MKTKIRKRPLELPQEKISIPLENGGDLKKFEKSLKIFLNSKLSNLILHLELRTEVRSDNCYFNFINKQLLKIGSNLKSVVI